MNIASETFKTSKMKIIVETLTHAGSGFGINEEGDAVFLSSRLVQVVGLKEGDLVTAHCIPNFEDKRDQIPWRGIRVDREPVFEAPKPTASKIEDMIGSLLDSDMTIFWTTKELSEELELDTKTTGNACLRLFNKGKIVKADVHSSPSQDRASWNLWSRNTDPFK